MKVCLDVKKVRPGGLCLLHVCRAGGGSAHVGEG